MECNIHYGLGVCHIAITANTIAHSPDNLPRYFRSALNLIGRKLSANAFWKQGNPPAETIEINVSAPGPDNCTYLKSCRSGFQWHANLILITIMQCSFYRAAIVWLATCKSSASFVKVFLLFVFVAKFYFKSAALTNRALVTRRAARAAVATIALLEFAPDATAKHQLLQLSVVTDQLGGFY